MLVYQRVNNTTASGTQAKDSLSMKPSGISQVLLNAHVILKLDTRRDRCSHILAQVLIQPARSSQNLQLFKQWMEIDVSYRSVQAYMHIYLYTSDQIVYASHVSHIYLYTCIGTYIT